VSRTKTALLAASAAALLLATPAPGQTSDEPLRDLWSEYPLVPTGTGERQERQQRAPPVPETRGNANDEPADNPAGGSTSSSNRDLVVLAVFAAVVGGALVLLLGTFGRGLALSVVEVPARLLPRVLSVATARRGLTKVTRGPERMGRRRRERTRPHPRDERTGSANESAAAWAEEVRASDRREPALALDAETEVCVIGLWRGYVMAQFLAIVLRPDGSEHVVAMSPRFPWRPGIAPSSDQDSVSRAFEALLGELEAGGWEWVEAGEPFPDRGARRGGRLWYELRFRRQVSPTRRGAAEHRTNLRSGGAES
jgi:hypothetical protein